MIARQIRMLSRRKKLTWVQVGAGSGGRIVPVDRGRKVVTEVIADVADPDYDARLWVEIREGKA